mgnify:CR=1 FL=1
MVEPALYDLSPLARLMLTGVVLAAAPLLWVWLRHREQEPAARLRALTWVTLFLTFDLIAFGAFTRLTDSGLGCPDWPGCYGSASPLGARESIRAAEAALPTGPVTISKAWIEMIHRYLATAVGVLILTMTVVSWHNWRQACRSPMAERAGPSTTGAGLRIHPAWATATLVWVCVQGAFGALTVTMKLFPAIVTLHLLGGLGLLCLLTVQAARLQASGHIAQPSGKPPVALEPSWLRAGVAIVLLLVVVQIALGGWVSTNYAVLACTEFPRCQGVWWPPMNFAEGFELWRELGHTAAGAPITFAALTAIHMAHRLFASVVVVALLLLAVVLIRYPRRRGQAVALGALLGLQLLTGLSNIVLGWPLLAAVLHTSGAAALMAVLTWAWAAPQTGAEAIKPAPLFRTSCPT